MGWFGHRIALEGAYNPPHTTYGSPQTVSTGGISTSPICSIYSRLRERYASLTRVDPTTLAMASLLTYVLTVKHFLARAVRRVLFDRSSRFAMMSSVRRSLVRRPRRLRGRARSLVLGLELVERVADVRVGGERHRRCGNLVERALAGAERLEVVDDGGRVDDAAEVGERLTDEREAGVRGVQAFRSSLQLNPLLR